MTPDRQRRQTLQNRPTGACRSFLRTAAGRKGDLPKGKPEDLDGTMVFNPQAKALAPVRLPERCANLAFGGPKNNRLYRASCRMV